MKTEYFDMLNGRLSGTNLIEASAGTGKTYTIEALFLRLIIENHIDIDKILVVTFTNAAAFELKERIRMRLGAALRLFSSDNVSDDNIILKDTFLYNLYRKHENNKKECVYYLKNAAQNFDMASIFTIHGFCQRILQKNAFESGLSFDVELAPNINIFIKETAEDFFRINIYGESPLFINYIAARTPSISLEYLYSFIKQADMNPFIEIEPDFSSLRYDNNDIEKEYENAFYDLIKSWSEEKDKVEQILLFDKGLNRVKYSKKTVECMIGDMDALSSMPYYAAAVLFKNFIKFTISYINDAVKKGCIPPKSPFFDICEKFYISNRDLTAFLENKILRLKLDLISYFEKERKKRKEKAGVRSFDDIILDFYYALHSDARNFAAKIREDFKAALIDEFQDTDSVQYDIFSTIFGDKKSILFLIGDPKQAIYSFRGADIFAYIKASETAEKRYTLRENWRSSEESIKALNTCLNEKKLPFVYKEIPFIASSYPENKDENDILTIDEKKEEGLKICFLRNEDKIIAKDDAKEFFLDYFSYEISKIVSLGREERAKTGDRFLKEKDIAVLVRTNEEAQRFKAALASYNLHSVLHNIKSIFETDEAFEMARLLNGILNYRDLKALKTALSCRFFGLNAKTLYDISENESVLEKWILKFEEYNNLLKDKGFMRMFRNISFKENFLANSTSLEDGERRASNLIHLSEILNEVFIDKKTDGSGLLKWLNNKIYSSDFERDEEFFADENLLRLESDDNAVNIITIHKSKGLEFPIVFCPFLFHGSFLKKGTDFALFHKKDGGFKSCLDIGSFNFEKAKEVAEKELLAENLRLLYVAVTRAKNLCFIAWGNIKNTYSSSLFYLFHRPEFLSDDFIMEDIKRHYEKVKDNLYEDIINLSLKSGGSIEVLSKDYNLKDSFLPELDLRDENVDMAQKELKARSFSGNIRKGKKISSFSSIILKSSLDMGYYGNDKIFEEISGENNKIETEEETSIFSFYRGTHAGLFMHELLEHSDFCEKNIDVIKKLILEKLDKYGYKSEWADVFTGMIKNLISINLADGISLGKIENKNRINEMKFYFPLNEVSPQNIASIFSEKYKERVERMDIKTVKGFMTGFIDAVFMHNDKFYIIDWKSNYLGNDIKDYAPERLCEVMIKHDYILQYHIYALALTEYLKKRISDYDYDKHFGGVFYIFLRGINKNFGDNYGIFYDRPNKVLIEKMEETSIYE